MQAKRLRFGVISTARIADAVIKGIRMSTNSELTAVASRDRERGQAWAKQRDVPNVFGSYEEMLASDVIDVAYIPLPNSMHKEWSIRAAQNGKHVLCEKPLANNAADAEEIIAAARSNGVTLMEAFMYRFHPQTEQIRQMAQGGAVGDVRIIRATFGFLMAPGNDIRWSAEMGGGALLDVGCYCANITRLVAGTEPVAVTAAAVWASTGVDQSVVGTMEFPGGVLATLDCSFLTGTDRQEKLEISGTTGRISVPRPFRMDENETTILVDKEDTRTPAEVVHAPAAYEYHRMVEHFSDAILNGRQPSYTPEDSLGNMRVLDALKESALTGRRVEIAR